MGDRATAKWTEKCMGDAVALDEFVAYYALIMVALRSRCGHYILQLWLLLRRLFPRPFSAVAGLDVYHTSTHGVALVRI